MTDRPDIQLNEVLARQVGQSELIESLQRLVKLAACSDTGGANVAAQVVLGTYNGSDYPMDLTELGRLDTDLFEDALNVIRLRVQYMREPHEFFVDGVRLFEYLATIWSLRPGHYDPIS